MNGLFYKDAHRQLEKFERFVELNEVIPLTEKIAKRAALIFSDLRKRGISIGHNDVMIAAVAIENKMTLITNNESHFQHVSGLAWENWLK